jgi:hypothetical protein
MSSISLASMNLEMVPDLLHVHLKTSTYRRCEILSYWAITLNHTSF